MNVNLVFKSTRFVKSYKDKSKLNMFSQSNPCFFYTKPINHIFIGWVKHRNHIKCLFIKFKIVRRKPREKQYFQVIACHLDQISLQGQPLFVHLDDMTSSTCPTSEKTGSYWTGLLIRQLILRSNTVNCRSAPSVMLQFPSHK